MPEYIHLKAENCQNSKFKSTDLVPIAPGTQVELDPLTILIDYAGFTVIQVVRIRADGYDSFRNLVIETPSLEVLHILPNIPKIRKF